MSNEANSKAPTAPGMNAAPNWIKSAVLSRKVSGTKSRPSFVSHFVSDFVDHFVSLFVDQIAEASHPHSKRCREIRDGPVNLAPASGVRMACLRCSPVANFTRSLKRFTLDLPPARRLHKCKVKFAETPLSVRGTNSSLMRGKSCGIS